MEMFNELADVLAAKAARYRNAAVRLGFSDVTVKAVTAFVDEAADHSKEWAGQSVTFLEQLFAAKTPVKAAKIQLTYSRHASEPCRARQKLSQLYASAINEARGRSPREKPFPHERARPVLGSTPGGASNCS